METNMDAALDYLKNIDSESEEMPAVHRVREQVCIVLKIQWKLRHTIRIHYQGVVKAQYTPNSLTENSSYFSWKGNYYTLEQLKTEYKNTPSGGLKTDLPIFLKKAKLVAGDADQSTIDNFITNLQANGLTAKTGIIGRFCAVRYYHESVCYYDVLILTIRM